MCSGAINFIVWCRQAWCKIKHAERIGDCSNGIGRHWETVTLSGPTHLLLSNIFGKYICFSSSFPWTWSIHLLQSTNIKNYFCLSWFWSRNVRTGLQIDRSTFGHNFTTHMYKGIITIYMDGRNVGCYSYIARLLIMKHIERLNYWSNCLRFYSISLITVPLW